jgi:epoxyqueuosine reductase QueG
VKTEKDTYRQTEEWIDRIADIGPRHPGELEEAYEQHYNASNDYIDQLEKRLKLIEQRFDRYCRDGLELGGFTHLPLTVPEAQRLLFDSLYKAIKDA